VGVVKQAKVQLEKAGGRSRGYGFVEYWSHRYALMGLRYMNGQIVPGSPPEDAAGPPRRRSGAEGERKKRLIVEFAMENWNQKTEKTGGKKKEDSRPVIAAAPRTQEIIKKKRMARRAKKAGK
jgi:nucleolar protein 4